MVLNGLELSHHDLANAASPVSPSLVRGFVPGRKFYIALPPADGLSEIQRKA